MKTTRVTDELRLYENIWKTRQKIVYKDQVKVGYLIHYIQNNENSKKKISKKKIKIIKKKKK